MKMRDAPLIEPSCNSNPNCLARHAILSCATRNLQKKFQAPSALAGATRYPTGAARNCQKLLQTCSM
ncbi:hypothetical protein A2U01_0062830 [Trifolium medium]|uniref:Uncharacterized protein n=1 Tax=Trifolium medium TaxID=97028 RepID=A0A392RZM1_9FABA|nr:hypothetical protein [Trifolium medium]